MGDVTAIIWSVDSKLFSKWSLSQLFIMRLPILQPEQIYNGFEIQNNNIKYA